MFTLPPGGEPDPFFLNTMSRACIGEICIASGTSTFTSTAWPAANLAMCLPIRITGRRTYQRACVCNGASVSGNFDIGIYALDGTRLFSTGTQAQAGVSQMQKVNISWTLDPGHYLMALSWSNNVGTVFRAAPTAGILQAAGVKSITSGFVLPTPATFTAPTAHIPIFGICEKTWL